MKASVEVLRRPALDVPLVESDLLTEICWQARFETGDGNYAAIGMETHPICGRANVLRQWGGKAEVVDLDIGFIDGAAPYGGGVLIACGSEAMYRSIDRAVMGLVHLSRSGEVVGDFCDVVGSKHAPQDGVETIGHTGDGAVLFVAKGVLYRVGGDGVAVRHAMPRATSPFAVSMLEDTIVAIAPPRKGADPALVSATLRSPVLWEVIAESRELETGRGWICTEPGVFEAERDDGKIVRAAFSSSDA